MQRKIRLQRRVYVLFLSTLLFFIAGFLLGEYHSSRQINYEGFFERAQVHYLANEATIESTLTEIQQQMNHRWLDEHAFIDENIHKPGGFNFFVFENNNLRFWSDNQLTLGTDKIKTWRNHQVVLYKNGWYEIFKRETGPRTLIGMYLLKHRYAYQNKYIVNSFNASFGLPENAELTIEKNAKTFAVKNSYGQYLFSIHFNNNVGDDNSIPFSAFAYGLGLICLFVFLLHVIVLLGRLRTMWGLVLLGVLFALRAWMSVSHFPAALYDTELFSPKYYASSYLLNSLGDLLISSMLLVLVVIYFYLYYSGLVLMHQTKLPRKRWSIVIIFILLLTFLISVFINYILSGLIINSQISFNINNIFELSGFSIIGLIVIGALLFAFYMVCDGSVRFIQKTHLGFGEIIIHFLITQGIFLLLLIWFRDTDFFINYGVSSFLLANTLMIFISYVRSTSRRIFSFTGSLLVVFGFSLYAAQIINEFNQIRERDKRLLLASKLENEQDLVAEYLFDDAAKRLETDTVLHQFLDSGLHHVSFQPKIIDELNRRLVRMYFSGYLGKYDVQFKYFTANEIPINTIGDPSWNLDLIKRNIDHNGIPTNTNNLYLMENSTGRIHYLSLMQLKNVNSEGFLVADLTARFVRDETGLPELLISDRINRKNDLTNYSYVRYQRGTLVNQSGSYNYYLTAAPYGEYYGGMRNYRFANFDNYSHLFYRAGADGLIVLSIYNPGSLVYITLFSYIFTFFSILFLVIYLLIRGTSYGFRIYQNFKGRIQITVISIVVVSLVLLGATTITYIVGNYTQAQNARIKEKLNSLIVLIENELGERKGFGTELTDDLAYASNQLAHTLAVDFNIYNSDGALLYSSQPTIYEQDIIAPLMNRAALTQLKNNQKAVYLQNEKIGSLQYIAAYESVRNNENQAIGYLNLPYFARESDLKREISSFLVALINIYVLLFSFAVGATFIISNRITRPLRIIQLGLKRTQLGKSNEPLVWKRKDEIGSLVNEYNRMLEELQNSADRLAKSERESAWREMAKQVAHEIKNPLTPMKLSVQHLQRAWMDNHPQLHQIVERISQTLIEQIETLSSIATAFSDFAKMPKAENAMVHLEKIIETTVNLYSETENIKINYNANANKDLMLYADKDQLLRVFSNLIKNATQSIPPEREGQVDVEIETTPDHYIVAIKDNGTGISEVQVKKIFVPNFTTKTGGTGLGLAMVKSMVESMEGTVWFETVDGKGTTFFVKLNKYRV